ncbi:hypothetical protein ACHAWF_013075, partial [Thalassiosira exigua]
RSNPLRPSLRGLGLPHDEKSKLPPKRQLVRRDILGPSLTQRYCCLACLPFFALFLCWLLLSFPCTSGDGDGEGSNNNDIPRRQNQQPTPSRDDIIQINQLSKVAYSNPEGSPQSISSWEQILSINPRHLEAHVILGWTLIQVPVMQEKGVTLLEASFDSTMVTPTIDYKFPQTFTIAATIGRYRAQHNEYAPARKFMEIALELSKVHGIGKSTNNKDGDLCIQMQLATMFDYFPESMEAADAALAYNMKYADRLLAQQKGWTVNDGAMSVFPGAGPDPYYHCMVQLFYLSFYYRADVAEVASKNYELARRGWPALNTTAKFVREYDSMTDHHCINRKIRLAVISGVLTEGHSNSESFGGMLSRLDRNIFEVTYVLLAEWGDKNIASFTKVHPSDRIFIWSKEAGDTENGAWTIRFGKEIESWEMDVIFYFDLTMSGVARRLGMQRLAPVQVNSHGHPITSGIDQSVMQYFISWGAAELSLEEAQTHYTEELKLLPSDIIYEYFERRVLPGAVSRMDGQPFGHLDRSYFDLPMNKRIYLCMQKPFKFHPEVDVLLCGIMTKDAEGGVVLHRETSHANQHVFEKRLERAGCDLSRIKFLEQQPHHRLLALYRESTVVLDSYPAGGDTTTREVIEMGKPLVTLPARLLGGRWSLGYLSNIGLKETTKQALIAKTEEEFIDLAVQLGTDDTLRERVEADLRQSSSNLFQRKEAVLAWQNLFLEISPYEQCTGFLIDKVGEEL